MASPPEDFLKNPRGRHSENPDEFFEKRIRPVLAEHCYRCHSAAAARTGKLKGKLQLDTRAGVQRGGASGVVVVPRFPDQSRLIESLSYKNEDLQMPPAGKLPAEVIADFVEWVARGAPDPRDAKAALTSAPDLESGRRHWAFLPLQDPPLPAPSTSASPNSDAWRHSPVDRFLLAKLNEKQLHPAREADRRTLIRRAYFDLIGLPPAPREVEAFVRDPSPDAFLRLVDRLLASPQPTGRYRPRLRAPEIVAKAVTFPHTARPPRAIRRGPTVGCRRPSHRFGRLPHMTLNPSRSQVRSTGPIPTVCKPPAKRRRQFPPGCRAALRWREIMPDGVRVPATPLRRPHKPPPRLPSVSDRPSSWRHRAAQPPL